MFKFLFSDRVFYKKLMQLALPMALQSLMLAAVAAADAIMLGSVDQNSMSAVSLATQIQFVQNMFIFGTIGTMGILGAQYWGKGDTKTLNDIFMISIRMNIVISVVFFVGCELFPEFLMLMFTDEKVLIDIGVKYLRIAGWSYLLTGISQCYLEMMKVTEHAKQTAIISSCAVIFNIIFNAIFIYGFFGIPAMGVEGAALATLIARIIEFIWSIAVSFNKGYMCPNYKRYSITTGY